jgi:hypothetical protein
LTTVTHTIVVTRPVLLPPGFGGSDAGGVETDAAGEGTASGGKESGAESEADAGEAREREPSRESAEELGVEASAEGTFGGEVQRRLDGPGMAGLGRGVFRVDRASVGTLVGGAEGGWGSSERSEVSDPGDWRPNRLGRTSDSSGGGRDGWSGESASSGWTSGQRSDGEVSLELIAGRREVWDVSWTTHSETAFTVGVTAVWLVFHGRVMAAAAAADALREAIDPTRVLERWVKK